MAIKDAEDELNSEKDECRKYIKALYQELKHQKGDLEPYGVKSISNHGGYDIGTAGCMENDCISLELKSPTFFDFKDYYLTIYCFEVDKFYLDLHYAWGYKGVTIWKKEASEEKVERAILEALKYLKSR